MKRSIVINVVLIMCVCVYGVSWRHMNNLRQLFLNYSFIHYSSPSKVVGPLSLEFKGVVSDFLFLKLITVMGEKIGKNEVVMEHSNYIYNSADTITDLDPYFWDSYIFPNMILSWEFGRYDDANYLLEKAKKYRVNDFRPPFFLGFNYFYFLKNNKKGADYLMEASLHPGCPVYVPKLASRLYATEYDYESAMVFLTRILENTVNPGVRQQLKNRLSALSILNDLEKKIRMYVTEYGHIPVSLKQLVESGYLETIPEDPYGGEFLIQADGRVFTTSKLRYIK